MTARKIVLRIEDLDGPRIKQGAARQAMEDSHAESQTGARAPKHTYSLADYGLTAGAVKERFAGL